MNVMLSPIVLKCLGISVVVAGAAMVGSAHTQLIVQTTTGQAARNAGAIVRAKVLDVQVIDRGWIWTDVDFETLEVVKGFVPARFRTSMLGGTIGESATGSGMPLPQFIPGTEVVLFVAPQKGPDGAAVLLRDHVYHVIGTGAARTVHPAPTGLSVGAADRRAGGAESPLAAFLNALRQGK